MQPSPTNTVIVFGTLHPDGTIRLDPLPPMPPGPVQVTIRRVQSHQRLPDSPVDDLENTPPVDLPRMGALRSVDPVRVVEHLPDPLQSIEAA